MITLQSMAMTKKWVLKQPGDPEIVGRLSTELGIDRVLAELLVQRGITTFEDAREFFRPDLSRLHDPFLMKDMDKAVERLHKAVAGGEKILVYGDYDVDGTTAVALVYSFISSLTHNVDFYIPEEALAIQVCYNPGDGGETWEREVNALSRLSKMLECRRRLIITRDTERRLEIAGNTIEVIPVWKWLLGF